MSSQSYNQNQSPVSYPAAGQGQSQTAFVAPVPAGYPTRDTQTSTQLPTETRSKGEGFWKGCCAALCCCCVLDTCF